MIQNPYRPKFSLIPSFAFVFLFCFVLIFYFQSKPKTNTPIEEIEESAQYVEIEKQLISKAEYNFEDLTIHDSILRIHFLIPLYRTDDQGQLKKRDDISIVNFYDDKLSFTDKNYVDIANYCLGRIHYHFSEYHSALLYFNQLPPGKFKDVIGFEIECYLRTKDATKATMYLEELLKVKSDVPVTLVKPLFTLQKYKMVESLFDFYKIRSQLSEEEQLYLYTRTYNLPSFIRVIFLKYFNELTVPIFAGSLLIVGIWVCYLFGIDSSGVLKPGISTIAFVSGGLIVVINTVVFYSLEQIIHPIPINSFLYFLLYAGVTEEILKFAAILFLLFSFSDIRQSPVRIFFYSMVIACGFSFTENLIHFQHNFSRALFIRGISAVPGHMIHAGIVTYSFHLKRHKFPSVPISVLLIIHLALSAISHGLYDYLASLKIITVFVIYFLALLNIWILMLNNVLNHHPDFSYFRLTDLKKLRLFLFIVLISLYFFQISLQHRFKLWYPGSGYDFLILFLVISGIVFLSYKITALDFCRNYTFKIIMPSHKALRENRPVPLWYKIGQLLAGSIIPHNYVGKDFKFINFSNTQAIQEKPQKITVLSREIITENFKNIQVNNPYWFTTTLSGTDEIYYFYFESDNPHFYRRHRNRIHLFRSTLLQGSTTSNKELNYMGDALLFK